MSNVFVPDYVYSDLYQIQPKKLAEAGIRVVFIDLDGTMASSHSPLPPDTIRPFLQGFLDCGIQVLVLSNNKEERVRLFCENLPVSYISRARKPFPIAYRKACAKTGFSCKQAAVIGDQIYTDTFGGNLAGATTIYVESLDKRDFWIHFRYQFERGFIWLGRRKQK